MTKCSYRTLFIPKYGPAIIITQDIRRKKNPITGRIIINKLDHPPINVHNAKSYGCAIIVREK